MEASVEKSSDRTGIINEVISIVKTAEKEIALGDYKAAQENFVTAAELVVSAKKSLDKNDKKAKEFRKMAEELLEKAENCKKLSIVSEAKMKKKESLKEESELIPPKVTNKSKSTAGAKSAKTPSAKSKVITKTNSEQPKSDPSDRPKPNKPPTKIESKVLDSDKWMNPAKAVKKPKVEKPEEEKKTAKKPAVVPKFGSGAKRPTYGSKPSAKPSSKVPKDILSQLEETIVDKKKMNTSLDDIKGQSEIKQAVQENIILPLKNPKLFTGIRAPSRAILLYGPPGNGKTLLAKALAHEIKRSFFNVSASSLMSKWVGEGEKLMKGLFTLAQERGPSIVFFDEIDSLLSQRKSSENEASRRMKTEFLVQFDGVGSDTSGDIIIVAATNRPFDLDGAAMRRFTKRIYVGLPDNEAREAIIQNLLVDEKCNLTVAEFNAIVGKLEGYSSSDLSYFCKEVAMVPLKDYSTDELAVLDPDELRPISYDDFLTAMKKVRPSYSADVCQEYIDWENSLALS